MSRNNRIHACNPFAMHMHHAANVLESRPDAARIRGAFQRAFDTQEKTLVRRLGNLLDVMEPGVYTRLDPGERWFYDRSQHVLTYPRRAVLGQPLPYNLGVVCRELACQRYTFAPSPAVLSEPGCAFVWVAIESVRASNLLCARYAGARALLREVYEPACHAPPQAALLLQYACGIAALWMGNTVKLAAYDRRVIAALALTRRDITQVLQSPQDADLALADLLPAQRINEARRSEQILRETIWPVLRNLADRDAAWQPPQGNGRQALEDLFGHLSQSNIDGSADAQTPPPGAQSGLASPQSSSPNPSHASPSSESPAATPPALTPEEINALAADASVVTPPQESAHKTPGGRSSACRLREPIQKGELLAGKQYDAIAKAQGRMIDALTGELEDIFRKQRLPRYTGHFKAGRYDLKKAVAEKFRERATGTRDPKVFLRRDEPMERSVGFILCADTSGSMAADQRIPYLRQGTVMLVEASEQLNLPIGVLSYDTHVTPHKRPHEDLTGARANSLVEHLTAKGSNNELAALEVAADMAQSCLCDEVYIVFITDGGGDYGLPGAIQKLETEDPRVRVFGVGIGPGCEEVPRLYKRNRQVEKIEDLPQELGRLLVEIQSGNDKP